MKINLSRSKTILSGANEKAIINAAVLERAGSHVRQEWLAD